MTHTFRLGRQMTPIARSRRSGLSRPLSQSFPRNSSRKERNFNLVKQCFVAVLQSRSHAFAFAGASQLEAAVTVLWKSGGQHSIASVTLAGQLPHFDSPAAPIAVARASSICELCADTTTFADLEPK